MRTQTVFRRGLVAGFGMPLTDFTVRQFVDIGVPLVGQRINDNRIMFQRCVDEARASGLEFCWGTEYLEHAEWLPDGQVINFGNEVNISRDRKWTVGTYVTALHRMKALAQARGHTVYFGNISNLGFKDQAFLHEIVDRAPARTFMDRLLRRPDVLRVGTHHYPDTDGDFRRPKDGWHSYRQQVANLKRITDRYPGHARTEMGVTTAHGLSDDQARDQIEAQFVRCEEEGCDFALLYQHADGDDPAKPDDRYGIVESDRRTLKPQSQVFRRAA